MKSTLYKTIITHQRYHDFIHKFKYSTTSMYINYEELILIPKKIKIFSYNKFNIFSFYDKDHGYRDGRSLKDFVENFLNLNKISFKDLKIKILCFPRIFGYVFNPLSIIYCYDNQKLIAIFYEVKNTSNEQHIYCFASNNNQNLTEYSHECNKNFYVSPFIGMKSLYKFKNIIPGDKISIIIDLYNLEDTKILTASQFGKQTKLNSFALLKQLILNPLVTIKIIFAIMYESLFIFMKGGKYYVRKKKHKDTISFEGKF
ncbi:DUF1365 domain-containing protein [Alphaproteobacteria bacterium]|nr:DUF1365 domain-containing protein [Alphaproteobacteria bacterium]